MAKKEVRSHHAKPHAKPDKGEYPKHVLHAASNQMLTARNVIEEAAILEDRVVLKVVKAQTGDVYSFSIKSDLEA